MYDDFTVMFGSNEDCVPTLTKPHSTEHAFRKGDANVLTAKPPPIYSILLQSLLPKGLLAQSS